MQRLQNLFPVLTVLCVLSCPFARVRAADNAKPNFVVILIDDMGYGDVGPFGSKLNRTPNLDKMAREGMKLTSFYGAPVCTPSRAQMMTGCYAKRVSLPVVIFPGCPYGLSAKEHTVASLLKAQGYATMAIGKWHLGDQPEFLPTKRGFDHYLGLPYSNDMGQQKGAKNKAARPPLPLLRDEKVIEAPANQDTLTARYTEEAVKFISSHKDGPFFLYFAHTAVHVPLHPGAAFKGKSANGAYGDWVEEVDWSVGRVLDTLRDLHLARNTFVLFTSDNGPWLTQGANGGIADPLRGGKATTWEGGMREPTIAWWPGKIAPNTVSDAVASEMDVLPTLVDLAGGHVPADRKIDGENIWPVLSGQSTTSPREALFYFNGLKLEAVRSGPWKLAIAPQGTGRKEGAPDPATFDTPRLYNLDADISESTNVAAEHPDAVARLQNLIRQMDADLGEKGKGPGVRPPDRVAHPQLLLKRIGAEYD
ncbi:MAG TPA: sulfatase [Verrucomicrobiae bacterium]|jgi:arylsulfatase A-like enzyme|nr:sulfatase [Verrucomicrobiae bacterium]